MSRQDTASCGDTLAAVVIRPPPDVRCSHRPTDLQMTLGTFLRCSHSSPPPSSTASSWPDDPASSSSPRQDAAQCSVKVVVVQSLWIKGRFFHTDFVSGGFQGNRGVRTFYRHQETFGKMDVSLCQCTIFVIYFTPLLMYWQESSSQRSVSDRGMQQQDLVGNPFLSTGIIPFHLK